LKVTGSLRIFSFFVFFFCNFLFPGSDFLWVWYNTVVNIKVIKDAILPILKEAGVRKSAIFGSLAGGTAKDDSDVDILVDFPDGKSLFDFIDLKIRLEEIIGKKVDLVEYDMIKPALRESILNNLVTIL